MEEAKKQVADLVEQIKSICEENGMNAMEEIESILSPSEESDSMEDEGSEDEDSGAKKMMAIAILKKKRASME